MFTLAFLTALAAMVVIYKLPKKVRRAVFNGGALTDVILSGGIAWFFMGTLGGALIGILAGLCMSVFLSLGRKLQ